MAATICTCDDFEVDVDGRLCLKLNCGLQHDAGGGISVKASPWPFDCDMATSAMRLYCDIAESGGDGRIFGPQRDRQFFAGANVNVNHDVDLNAVGTNEVCTLASFSIDATDWCEDGQYTFTMIAQWDVTPLVIGTDYDVYGEFRIGPGAFTNGGQMLNLQNAPNGNPLVMTGTNGVSAFTLAAGAIHTIQYRTCVHVSSGQVHVDSLRAQIRGIAYTERAGAAL